VKVSLLASAVALSVFSSAIAAEGRTPGSCLIYPIHRSAPGWYSILNVTNTNLQPATPQSFGGTTNIQFNYVNTIPNPADSQIPLDCFIVDRVESLTPGDTLSVLTSWHNAANQEGYVVVAAQDPSEFKTEWQFDYVRARFTEGPSDRDVPRITPMRWGGGLVYRHDRVKGRFGFLRGRPRRVSRGRCRAGCGH